MLTCIRRRSKQTTLSLRKECAINPRTATGVNDGKRIDKQMDRPCVNDMAVEIGS
jgi:hypothetical protein